MNNLIPNIVVVKIIEIKTIKMFPKQKVRLPVSLIEPSSAIIIQLTNPRKAKSEIELQNLILGPPQSRTRTSELHVWRLYPFR